MSSKKCQLAKGTGRTSILKVIVQLAETRSITSFHVIRESPI